MFICRYLYVYLYIYNDQLTFFYSIATCIALYFALHDLPHSIYFDALLKSKINVICNLIGLSITLIFRYVLVALELNIIWLVVLIVSITLIPYLTRIHLYNKIKTDLKQNYNIKTYKKYMIGAGRKLFLYSLAVIIYTRTSQIFLGMKSEFDLGIYTVAMTIGTSFAFVLNAIITSYMSQIYAEKDLYKSQQMTSLLYVVISLISLFAILFLYILGPYIIHILYGEMFTKVNDILIFIAFSYLLSSISNISDKYLVKESAYKYLSKKTNILVIFNIIISATLILLYGLIGAVFSIFLTELFSATLFNYFFRKGEIFKIQKNIFSFNIYKNILGNK